MSSKNGFMRYRYPAVLSKEHYVHTFLERMGATLVLDTCGNSVIPSRKLNERIKLGVGMHTTESVMDEKGRWKPKTEEASMEKDDFMKLAERMRLRKCIEHREGFSRKERETLKPLLPEVGKFKVRELFKTRSKEIYRLLHGSLDGLSRAFYKSNPNNKRERYVYPSTVIVNELMEGGDWKPRLTGNKNKVLDTMSGQHKKLFNQEGLEALRASYMEASEVCIQSLADRLMGLGAGEEEIERLINNKGAFWKNVMTRNIRFAMSLYMGNMGDDMEREISSGKKIGKGYDRAVAAVCRQYSDFGNDMDVVALAQYLAPYRPFVGIVSEDSDIIQLNAMRNCIKESTRL